jgi:hypothetical protein
MITLGITIINVIASSVLDRGFVVRRYICFYNISLSGASADDVFNK